MSAEEKQSNSPGWLQRVQEQSWEPEILISGIVLFALLQIPPYLDDFGRFLDTYSFSIFSAGTVDRSLLATLYTANYWLIAGFTAHLIFRSVWVAFVGLSYVYPHGVREEKLKYAAAYKKLLNKNTDYRTNILRLERVSSTIFAVSFLFFMCVIGLFFALTIVASILGLLFEVFPEFMQANQVNIDPIISVLLFIYLFDFVSLGLLKRIPYVSKVYYPFYRIMSLLTLAPLYRNIYYGFVSNHKSWKVGLWMFAFAVISFFLARAVMDERQWLDVMELRLAGSDEYVQYHGHYDNLMGEDPSSRIQIASDVVNSTALRVFVVHNSGMEQIAIFPLCNYEVLHDSTGIDRDSLKLECLSSFYKLSLDDSLLQPEYFYHEKQQTGQVGLLAHLDIARLPRGKHVLKLEYLLEDGEQTMALVEFFKENEAERD